jgi:ABC-type glycerol-3-phosphate transport system permease component
MMRLVPGLVNRSAHDARKSKRPSTPLRVRPRRQDAHRRADGGAARGRQHQPADRPHQRDTQRDDYETIIGQYRFVPYLISSAVVGLGATGLTLLTAGMAAFALARMRCPGHGLIAQTTLIMRMTPPAVLAVTVIGFWLAWGTRALASRGGCPSARGACPTRPPSPAWRRSGTLDP